MEIDEQSDLDETLQRWFSSLSPEERLEATQSHANLIVAARGLDQVLSDRARDDRFLENSPDAD